MYLLPPYFLYLEIQINVMSADEGLIDVSRLMLEDSLLDSANKGEHQTHYTHLKARGLWMEIFPSKLLISFTKLSLFWNPLCW